MVITTEGANRFIRTIATDDDLALLLERELRRLDLEDHVVVETCERRGNGS